MQASCPNSCSGHGICDSNDQCQCYREGKVLNEEGNYDGADLFNQFTGADCSLMACPRGTSWNVVVASSGVDAHMKSVECSDAGTCKSDTGMCECYPGFDGSACQRTTCPNDCNGHGVCQSNEDFAEDYARAMAKSINLKQRMPRCADGSSDYAQCLRNIEHLDDYYQTYMVTYENAWDSGLQYGCKCDSGFSGADCSERDCPTSFDPLDSSCSEAINTDPTSFTETYMTLTQTNIEQESTAPALWKNLPIPFPSDVGLDVTTLDATFALGDLLPIYLSYFGQSSIFYAPKEFKSGSTHFSDMARRCTSFYIAPDMDTVSDVQGSISDPGANSAWTIAPISADSWMCNYMWDSTMTKTPYCAGRWTSLECSGRGLCDRAAGTCACSAGYTGNDCSAVSELG